MTKIAINNEIVLLRHTVRQARVCVVNKLTKEVKLLQKRHGSETQQEKYKRKANKLIAEIYALKKMKVDDISKFGIMNERDLPEILQDQSLSDSDRVTARVVHYKILYKKILQFKKKFPDCKKYLTEENKKMGKLKSKTESKPDSKESNLQKQDKNIHKQEILVDETIENVQDRDEEDDKRNPDLSEMKPISHKRKASSDSIVERNKLMKTKSNDALEDEVVDNKQPIIKLHSVTKEATVKRFTELLEEEGSNEDMRISIESRDSIDDAIVQEKIVDDFFITGNNQENDKKSDTALTSSTQFYQCKTQPNTVSLKNRFTKPNANYKNDTKFKPNQRYNELKNKANTKDSQNKKYLNKETLKTGKREPNKINKNTNDLNDIKNTEDLHPSWLAKKKQQEVMSQGFQGKKIVFDFD